MLQKKAKIIALTAAVFMISAPLLAAPSEPNKVQTLTQKINSIADPNWSFKTSQDDTSGIYFKLMAAVGLVLVFGAAALYLSKKLGTKIVNTKGKQMQIDETLYLGSRKALHLVKISNERILIATTPTSVTTIAKLENQKPVSENENEQ